MTDAAARLVCARCGKEDRVEYLKRVWTVTGRAWVHRVRRWCDP